MLIEVEVCDVCERVGVPVVRYTITEPGSGRSGDTVRCSDDAAPFEDVLGPRSETAAPAEASKPRPAAPAKAAANSEPQRRRSRKVTTLAEIEAAKAAGKA